MPANIKELVVVLVIASGVFWFGKPILLRFQDAKDYTRRRNVWFVLTAAAFLSPNFWLFLAVALPMYLWAGRKDSNPAAFYLLMLHVVPPISITIPMIGISHLFDIDNYLLLSLCVLLPSAIALRKSPHVGGWTRLESPDWLLLGYCVLQSVCFLHSLSANGSVVPLTATEALRRAFLFFVGTCVPYFTVSRINTNRAAIVDAASTYCLACMLLAAIAIFEAWRHWLLYGDMIYHWGMKGLSQYLARGGSLRATASTGDPLPLGYLLAVGCGIWLFIGVQLRTKPYRWAVTLLFWGGLLASFSRGPWVTVAVIYLAFAALGPRPIRDLIKILAAGVAAMLVIAVTPLGDKIMSVIPMFGGTVDSFNITYRQHLLDRSLQVIHESPIFGDPNGLAKLQDLRQGQGIVDLVNSYVEIALNTGLTGLLLLLSFMSICLYRVWVSSRRVRLMDPDFSKLGVSLAACIVGTLVMLADGSLGTGIEKMFYVLAALATGYMHICRSAPHLSRNHESIASDSPMASKAA